MSRILIISNSNSGAAQLLDFMHKELGAACDEIKLFEIHLGTTIDKTHLEEVCNQSEKCIHLQRSYKDLVAQEKDPLRSAKTAARNDAQIRQALLHHSHLTLMIEQVPYRIEELEAFLKNHPFSSPSANKKPQFKIQIPQTKRTSYNKEMEKELDFLEDRRSFIFASKFLTQEAQQKTRLSKEYPPVEKMNIQLSCSSSSFMLLDGALEESEIKKFLSPTQHGQIPTCAVIVFSHFGIIQVFLQDPYYFPLLQNGRLTLWHISEYKDCLLKKMEHIRSSITACQQVISPHKELALEAYKTIKLLSKEIFQNVHRLHEEISAYYVSEEFCKRRKDIIEGAKARVYVILACHTVAVKQFSRNIAVALADLGCEVYIHPTCPPDQTDFMHASLIEIAHFKPDLIIGTPNIYKKIGAPIDIKGAPKIYPVQDLRPHMDLPEYLSKEETNPYELYLLMQKRFVEPVLQSGLSPEQVLFDFLPAEKPCIDAVSYPMKDLYDVGITKTMQSSQDLLSLINTHAPHQISPQENKQILESEKTMLNLLKEESFMDLYACEKLAGQYDWGSMPLTYLHEKLCLSVANYLNKKKFKLNLSGANWNQFPNLAKYATGHANSREAYLETFLKCKINLSLNPWNEYHPRIFDGGRLGAFFLIYKIPENIRWQGLPECLRAGEHFDYYSSREELVDKCNYYLKNDSERIQIGRNLKKAIDEQFNYERMAKTLLEQIKKVMQKTSPIVKHASTNK